MSIDVYGWVNIDEYRCIWMSTDVYGLVNMDEYV